MDKSMCKCVPKWKDANFYLIKSKMFVHLKIVKHFWQSATMNLFEHVILWGGFVSLYAVVFFIFIL